MKKVTDITLLYMHKYIIINRMPLIVEHSQVNKQKRLQNI